MPRSAVSTKPCTALGNACHAKPRPTLDHFAIKVGDANITAPLDGTSAKRPIACPRRCRGDLLLNFRRRRRRRRRRKQPRCLDRRPNIAIAQKPKRGSQLCPLLGSTRKRFWCPRRALDTTTMHR
jgi:hypothetical protein